MTFRFALLVAAALALAPARAAEPALSFNRDIRPILSETCFSCHGPDKKARKAGRRLDTREGALAESDGVRAIVPGDLAASELVARIGSQDPEERMPPPESERKLTARQIAMLRKWIEQGAQWEPHWAFVAPKRPAVPKNSEVRNPIDAFILARLEGEGLKPSPEADKSTLIRRVSYDLTGLPPTLAELDTFLADTAPDAYERLVDRLLASPRYGEKMAVHWLDLARYADTHGYHLDAGREQWPWRDWVIASFNRNQRFDEFVTWQLAGDLLPGATTEQKLATGFVRNNMINFEGGAIAEEYLAAYIKDRVNTVGTAFLGLTVACCECHDHKFDPITQKDFYQLYAYFNAAPEAGLDGRDGNAAPLLELPAPPDVAKRLAAATARVAEAEKQLTDPATPKPSADLEKARAELKEARKLVPTAMVMQQMDVPRETHLLIRGQYNQPGDLVEPGVPASLGILPPDAPENRLALARWIADPQNPLMARVTVNRFWKSAMGTGLVKTLNDFGSQGEWPSHPELLDWLATEFVASGWDVKHIVRLIVTSGAYRRSSSWSSGFSLSDGQQPKGWTPAAWTPADPDNRLHARGPRFRLSAEEIRDSALAVSGLLNPQIGGPSLSPYQPAGLWEELSSRGDSKKWTAQFFEQSHGADLYRRSMYTFWKRTCPPPQMQTFDAPDREVCTVNRERTNTPLQALVTLNDPTYIEAARKLAERMMTSGSATPAERVQFAFRLATARAASAAELQMLLSLFEQMKSRYTGQPDEARKLLATGEAPRNEALDAAELAAWTMVASTILNLDEAITKG